MPRLLWLMFHVPISSPQITRILGLSLAARAEPSEKGHRTSSDAAPNSDPIHFRYETIVGRCMRPPFFRHQFVVGPSIESGPSISSPSKPRRIGVEDMNRCPAARLL